MMYKNIFKSYSLFCYVTKKKLALDLKEHVSDKILFDKFHKITLSKICFLLKRIRFFKNNLN